MKVLYRYSTKDGKYVWPQGKTEALRACRQASKLTPNDITLEVQEVTLKDLTNKTMLRAALNGEDVVAIGEDGEYQIKVIAEVKGKIKPLPAPSQTLRGLVAESESETEAPKAKPRKKSPWLEPSDDPEQEYVSVYTLKGERMIKLEHLRKGMRISSSNPRSKAVTW